MVILLILTRQTHFNECFLYHQHLYLQENQVTSMYNYPLNYSYTLIRQSAAYRLHSDESQVDF